MQIIGPVQLYASSIVRLRRERVCSSGRCVFFLCIWLSLSFLIVLVTLVLAAFLLNSAVRVVNVALILNERVLIVALVVRRLDLLIVVLLLGLVLLDDFLLLDGAPQVSIVLGSLVLLVLVLVADREDDDLHGLVPPNQHVRSRVFLEAEGVGYRHA